jgi:hypothetical protein
MKVCGYFCLLILGMLAPFAITDWHLWVTIGLIIAYGEFRRAEK